MLLHGGGQTRHSWTGTAHRLADRGWRAITIDGRGHGDSEWHSATDYSLRAFALDLASVVASFDEPVVLVGASLGGATSIYLEGDLAPASARAVVLVDIVPQVEVAGAQRIHKFMTDRLYDGFADLEEARDAIAAYNPHRPPPRDLLGLKKNLRQGDDGRWRWHYDPAFADVAKRSNGPSEVSDLAFIAPRHVASRCQRCLCGAACPTS